MNQLNAEDITVTVLLSTNTSNCLARATVVFYGIIETHGWRIMTSKMMHKVFHEEIWIQAPSFKGHDSSGLPRWKETVFIDDKESWELVHQMIYEAFKEEQKQPTGKTSDHNIVDGNPFLQN